MLIVIMYDVIKKKYWRKASERIACSLQPAVAQECLKWVNTSEVWFTQNLINPTDQTQVEDGVSILNINPMKA